MARSPRRPAHHLATVLAFALVALVFAVAPTPGADDAVDAATGATSRYAAVPAAVRVVDTRTGPLMGRLPAGGSLSVAPVTSTVASAAGIAAGDAVAVVVNVTLVGTENGGYATVYPDGEPLPPTSSINADGPGQTVANTVTVRLGSAQRIAVFASTGTDVLIDVQGVYVSAARSTLGRLVTVAPFRAEDTRQPPANRIPAGGSLTVDLTAVVPASASAAVLNVAAVGPAARGFLTVWDGVGPPPVASNLNYVAGSIVANQVITGVDDGKIEIFSYAESDVIVDVVGYMTGNVGAPSDIGLFVPAQNGRLLDTRQGHLRTCGTPIGDGDTLSIQAMGNSGIPATGVSAIATNTTMTQTAATGFLTIWGPGSRPNDFSSVNNVGPNRTLANHVITAVDGTGGINVFTFATTAVVIDVTGYYTGNVVAAQPIENLQTCDNSLKAPAIPSTPASGPHEYLFAPTSAPGGFGRWNPCDPARPANSIRFALNTQFAKQVEIDQLYAAIRVIEGATGFDFVPYKSDPRTTGGLDDRRPPAGADMLLGFSNDAVTPSLAGGVLGVGGGFWFPQNGRVTTGFMIVDIGDLGTGNDLLTTLIHEMGHAMGLDHVAVAAEIMYPFNVGKVDLGVGDKYGLWTLGAGPGCTASPPLVAESVPSAADGDPVLVERATSADHLD